jgi:hypothetical protein
MLLTLAAGTDNMCVVVVDAGGRILQATGRLVVKWTPALIKHQQTACVLTCCEEVAAVLLLMHTG